MANPPNGWYVVAITASAYDPADDGAEEVLAMTFEIAEGSHAGRTIAGRFRLLDANPMMAKRAAERLAAICRAVGASSPLDTDDLHGIRFNAKIVDGRLCGCRAMRKAVSSA